MINYLANIPTDRLLQMRNAAIESMETLPYLFVIQTQTRTSRNKKTGEVTKTEYQTVSNRQDAEEVQRLSGKIAALHTEYLSRNETNGRIG